MKWDNLKIRITKEHWDFGYGLRMWVRTESGKIAVPEPIMLKVHEEGAIAERGPDMVLSPETVQFLMDSLWDAGIRPTEGSGSAGSLAATQRHLADMRALAAKALQTELPK